MFHKKRDYFEEIARKFDEKRKYKKEVELIEEENQKERERRISLLIDPSLFNLSAKEFEKKLIENRKQIEIKNKEEIKPEERIIKDFNQLNDKELEVFFKKKRNLIENKSKQ